MHIYWSKLYENSKRINWSKPHLLGQESIKVKKTIDTSWISGGKNIKIFENKLSNI